MELRVKALEDDVRDIKKDLKSLLVSAARIEGKIDSLPSSYEFGQLKGRVDTLPTSAKLATMIGIAVAALTLVSKWSEFTAYLKSP